MHQPVATKGHMKQVAKSPVLCFKASRVDTRQSVPTLRTVLRYSHDLPDPHPLTAVHTSHSGYPLSA